MNKSRLKIFATAGILLLGTTALSLPAFSHQRNAMGEHGGVGSMPMGMMGNKMGGGGHMGMMGNMMGGGGHMGMMGNKMGGGGHMGMMGDMMSGGGHMGRMGKYKGLGLSDEQTQQMRDIQYKLRKMHWEIMGQMIDQQAALQKAYTGDRPDPAAVGAVYGKLFDLKRQMIEASLTAKNSTRDVLTEEQRVQMKKSKHKRGCMMQGQSGQSN